MTSASEVQRTLVSSDGEPHREASRWVGRGLIWEKKQAKGPSEHPLPIVPPNSEPSLKHPHVNSQMKLWHSQPWRCLCALQIYHLLTPKVACGKWHWAWHLKEGGLGWGVLLSARIAISRTQPCLCTSSIAAIVNGKLQSVDLQAHGLKEESLLVRSKMLALKI